MNVQVIEKNGKPEWAIIPYYDYEKLQKKLEDFEDIQAIENNLQAIQAGKEIAIPSEITFSIVKGVTPIQAWREYKQIKKEDLAKKINISPAHLSQIENKNLPLSIEILQKVATVLDIETGLLI